MKGKLMFMFGFLSSILLITSLVTYTTQTLSNKVISFYSDNQRDQESAFLGDFTKGRSQREMNLDKNSEIGDKVEKEKSEEGKIIVGKVVKKEPVPFEEKVGESHKIGSYVFLTLLAIAIMVFFLVVRKRRESNNFTTNAIVVYKHEDAIQGEDIYINEPLSKDNQNEIRWLLQEWQGKLRDEQKKRPNETIHEWFRRIGGPLEIIPIYEKVRYGYQHSTKDEYDLLYSRFTLDHKLRK
ncbi:hypothetical protein LCL96_01740 [Rossellomorea aquimaris]|uniref:hypothetical protein n=1 Tax=Rossellomorea aquimaris TaxID=189382 RepID=UPI001CD67CE6|nr:hypothetical protein [Rossellomorea aquimaris]MCA1057637.1 hypothetical protein [Rossellomorea aquimaris]